MKYHNFSQASVFLTYINKVLNNDFVRMELKTLLEGQSVGLKKYLEKIKPPKITEQEAKTLLWGYNQFYFESKNLENALSEYNLVIESFEDERIIHKKLDKHLEKLYLPRY